MINAIKKSQDHYNHVRLRILINAKFKDLKEAHLGTENCQIKAGVQIIVEPVVCWNDLVGNIRKQKKWCVLRWLIWYFQDNILSSIIFRSTKLYVHVFGSF